MEEISDFPSLKTVQEKEYRRLREEPTSPTEGDPNRTMKIEIQQQLQVQAGGISDQG